MAISPAQVHRLENGQRRLSVDALVSYCRAIGVEPGSLFGHTPDVPITGVIDSDFEIQPVPPDTPQTTPAPTLALDMKLVAALRWAAGRRFQPMHNHLVFYRTHDDGIPEGAWDKRCLILRSDGRRYLGWPKKTGNRAHIDFGSGPVEFNVSITWASPVIAVMPPFAVEQRPVHSPQSPDDGQPVT